MMNVKNVDEIVREYSFPLYLYKEDVISRQVSALKQALPDFDIYYSIKANPNKHICRYMSRRGLGADAASARSRQSA